MWDSDRRGPRVHCQGLTARAPQPVAIVLQKDIVWVAGAEFELGMWKVFAEAGDCWEDWKC